MFLVQVAKRMAMAAATKAKESPINMAKYKDTSAEMLAASMFDSIYNALKTGKMSEAPGASSPGGTRLKYNPKTGNIE